MAAGVSSLIVALQPFVTAVTALFVLRRNDCQFIENADLCMKRFTVKAHSLFILNHYKQMKNDNTVAVKDA